MLGDVLSLIALSVLDYNWSYIVITIHYLSYHYRDLSYFLCYDCMEPPFAKLTFGFMYSY